MGEGALKRCGTELQTNMKHLKKAFIVTDQVSPASEEMIQDLLKRTWAAVIHLLLCAGAAQGWGHKACGEHAGVNWSAVPHL